MDILKLKSAYEIHYQEIFDLLERNTLYNNTQLGEMKEILDNLISREELKRMIFGKEISLSDMKSKPLGKMISDLHKELDIY